MRARAIISDEVRLRVLESAGETYAAAIHEVEAALGASRRGLVTGISLDSGKTTLSAAIEKLQAESSDWFGGGLFVPYDHLAEEPFDERAFALSVGSRPRAAVASRQWAGFDGDILTDRDGDEHSLASLIQDFNRESDLSRQEWSRTLDLSDSHQSNHFTRLLREFLSELKRIYLDIVLTILRLRSCVPRCLSEMFLAQFDWFALHAARPPRSDKSIRWSFPLGSVRVA